MSELGRLERVDLRKAWVSESCEFTPWLAEEDNLVLLGDTIGLELELEAREKEVGLFRADILCKDTATGDWVLIENQLERTDHNHLGQLMVYAAGLKAVTIVWIAQRFTDEHRAALDWLNEITDDRFRFFGLEVELWRIGESPLAPKFNVICQPNNWSKTVAEGAARMQSGELTPNRQLQLAFWTDFRAYLTQKGSKLKTAKPYPQHWMDVALGRSSFNLAAIASRYDSTKKSYQNQELRAELVITGDQSKSYYRLLEQDRDEIERELGEPLTWHNPPEKRMCRVYVRSTVDLDNRDRWPEYFTWLLEKLEKLYGVFGPRVRKLKTSDSQIE
ncbi:MAG: DUF4268 domain-containing protein [Candidatus Hydrogenedentes bacterium]|nr:DUF4268 domain-containing protein [Candidatus Hydrogenedentota bacterium]